MDLLIRELTSDSINPQVRTDSSNTERWLAYLPYMSGEMACLVFRCFLRRVTSILSDIDFSAPRLPPLPENIPQEFTVFKLLNASTALLKMYNCAGDQTKKNSFLNVLVKERGFVYFTIQLICKVVALYGDPVVRLWLGPATGFIGLVAWSLDANDEPRSQLEEQGLLMQIINQLKQLSPETVQTLTEDKSITQAVWLTVRILFQCAIKSKRLQLLCNEHDCLSELLHLQDVPDVELRMLIKALFLNLAPKCELPSSNPGLSVKLLTDEEITRVKSMLQNSDGSEPFSFHGLSNCILVSILASLARDCGNILLFMQGEVIPMLAEFSEKVESEKLGEKITGLIWMLMQGDAQDEFAEIKDDAGEIANIHQSMKLSEGLDTIPSNEAATEFTELLLKYLTKTILPYENISLEDGIRDLSEETWFDLSECLFLLALILNESSCSIKKTIIQCFKVLPDACRAIHLAFYMGTLASDEGLPSILMPQTISEILQISVILSDQSRELGYELAKSGYVQLFLGCLQSGAYMNTSSKESKVIVTNAFVALLNLSYTPENYPAFFFTEAIVEILKYVSLPSQLELITMAKFTLSCMHMHLDCEQLHALVLNDKEAEYCIATFRNALKSPDLTADGYAVHEILYILSNLTHPSHSTSITLSLEKSTVPDSFDQKFIMASKELTNNCLKLISYGIISLLEELVMDPGRKFISLACKILWNLLHHPSVESIVTNNTHGVLKALENTSHQDTEYAIYCCLWFLESNDEKDHDRSLKYARGCYMFGSYSEAAAICSKIIENAKNECHKELKQQATLLKGKALFYQYQRKIFYLMEKKPTMSKAEEKTLIKDCLIAIKETIALLGEALDNLYIDEEGSKLLDWAMMDCVRETNCLDQCKRCLLCRHQNVKLCRSHIFPKFILKNAPASSMTFGLDKYRMKSPGECFLWLCCKRCEGIMTQNAENDFYKEFPSSGSVEYSSWLYNYCCVLLFRTLSCVKFPRAFNDEEVYETFLSCRKHLLALSVKSGGSLLRSAESEEYQYQLLSKIATKGLQPYIFKTPSTMKFVTEDGTLTESTLPLAIPWLAPHRLIDGHRDLAGLSHFFVVYADSISILLKFQPSIQCNLPTNSLVSPFGGTFVLPDESESMKLIPKGLLVLYHRSALKNSLDLTEMLQQLTTIGAKKILSKGQLSFTRASEMLSNVSQVSDPETRVGTNLSEEHGNAPTSILNENDNPCSSTRVKIEGGESIIQFHPRSNKPRLSLLPPSFNIIQPPPNTQFGKSVELPKGHKIVLHLVEDLDSCSLTVFLAIGSSDGFLPDQPYVIFYWNGKEGTYLDGSFVTCINGEICFNQFLLEHSINTSIRCELQEIHDGARLLTEKMLLINGFLSLLQFIMFLRFRQSMKGADDILSLGRKCSTKGCWYCCDLCHCCMKKTFPVSSKEDQHKTEHRFCSKKCMSMFCFNPIDMQQSMFVIDHREEFLLGKFKGPSVLDVIKIHRNKDDKFFNAIEFIHIGLGDGSEDIPHGQPYILWQSRSIDFQFNMSFCITKDCVPLNLIFIQSMKADLMQSAIELRSKVFPILNTSMKALNCESIADYLTFFHL